MITNCLNTNDVEVYRYITAYGLPQTYKLYAQHDYFLPDFAAYQRQKETDVLPQAQAQAFLASVLPLDSFSLSSVQSINDLVPAGTEAAFYQDTFHFGQVITRGAAAEEAFHAIFQRLITSEKREALLKTGMNLLKGEIKAKGFASIRQYYQHQLAINPLIYGKLTEEAGCNRLYEEALAQAYVRYTTYGPLKVKTHAEQITARLAKAAQVVAQVLQPLFKLLDKVIGLFHKNRLYEYTDDSEPGTPT